MTLVIAELDEHQKVIGEAPKDAPTDDPREAIRRTRVYYQNQHSRMDYPRYRMLGFPLTSRLMESAVRLMESAVRLMESAVRLIGRRIKGSEKSWSATGGDGVLTLPGDLVSDDKRFGKFLSQFTAPTDGTRAYNTAATRPSSSILTMCSLYLSLAVTYRTALHRSGV